MNKEHKLLQGIIAVSVVLGTVCLTLMGILWGVVTRSNLYATQLENMYKRALYQLVGNVNDIELDISKAISTTTLSTQREILTRVNDNTVQAVDNLAVLPLASKNTSNFFDILNHIGGYTQSIVDNLNEGIKLTSEQLDTLSGLHSTSLNLVYELNDYLLDLDLDYEIINNVDFRDDFNSSFTGGLNNIESEKEGMPTLIYDGPFSDSVLNKEIVGLPEGEVTVEEATQIVQQKLAVYSIEKINYTGDSNGKFVTYNFEVTCTNCSLYVQITKQGGFILSIVAYGTAQGEYDLTEEQAQTLATNIATIFEIKNMQAVWTSTNGNIIYVNLAPVVDGVIYYPDLIKVKIDKYSGIVIGWEATNYATNHTNRSVPSPEISITEANKVISPALTVIDTRLAIIPQQYVGEHLTYEYICEWKDYTYYVYVDTVTGEEVQILRVVKTTRGDLIV